MIARTFTGCALGALALALCLLEDAPGPRTTEQSPLKWAASPDWKVDYSNIDRLTPEEIRRKRLEFDQGKAQAQGLRQQLLRNK